MDLQHVFDRAPSRTSLMPAPTVCLRAGVDWYADVPPALQSSTVDLMYVTDRAPSRASHASVEYGSDRSTSLAFGSARIEIGNGLDWPTLVAQTVSTRRTRDLPVRLESIAELGRFAPTPGPLMRLPSGEVVERPDAVRHRAELIAIAQEEVRRRLSVTPMKEVFIYVHGYHCPFERAARIQAEFWHSGGRVGVPLLYTWPAGSPGLLRGYAYDRESGEFTIFHFKNLIRTLAGIPEVERIHVFAHSRGTDVVSSALRELLIEERGGGRSARETMRIGQVVLASPDLDLEVAQQRYGAERFYDVCRRLTVYSSQADRAITWAGRLFQSIERLGRVRLEDLTAARQSMLDVFGNFDIVDFRLASRGMGHSYYRSHPAAASDVILTLRGVPAGSAERPLRRAAPHYWVLDEARYPEAMLHS